MFFVKIKLIIYKKKIYKKFIKKEKYEKLVEEHNRELQNLENPDN